MRVTIDMPELEISRDGNDATIVVRGDLTGIYVDTLRTALKESFEAEAELRTLTVDMRECPFIDSSCMGLLAGCKKELTRRGAKMRLINVPEVMAVAMRRIGMHRVMQIVVLGDK